MEPTLELVIPFYCGRKNKVTVVYVRFFFCRVWREKKRNGKKVEKEKRKTQEDKCQGIGLAPDNTIIPHSSQIIKKE